MRLRLAVLASLMLCAAFPASAAMQLYSINIAGVTRTFWLELPRAYSSSKTYGVVMVLHGGQGDGQKAADQTDLAQYSRGAFFTGAGGFVAVYPNAMQTANGTQWNDGRAYTSGVPDDVAFLSAVMDWAVASYGRAPTRTYLAGASSGGMMTYRMMCEQTARFRAYTVAVAGHATELVCNPAGVAPLNSYAGTEDAVMYPGGEMRLGGAVLSHQQTIDFWRANNGCAAPPLVTTLPTLVNDGTYVIKYDYGCNLEDYVIVGGGHAWPGGQSTFSGVATKNLDGTKVMVDFFRRFGL